MSRHSWSLETLDETFILVHFICAKFEMNDLKIAVHMYADKKNSAFCPKILSIIAETFWKPRKTFQLFRYFIARLVNFQTDEMRLLIWLNSGLQLKGLFVDPSLLFKKKFDIRRKKVVRPESHSIICSTVTKRCESKLVFLDNAGIILVTDCILCMKKSYIGARWAKSNLTLYKIKSVCIIEMVDSCL